MKKLFVNRLWHVALILSLILSLFSGCKNNQTVSSASKLSSSASVEASASADTSVPDETKPPVDPASIHPMLFHVTGDKGQEGYLFGTIHVGDKQMDTALEKLLPYVDRCDALAVEFDVVAFEKRPSSEQAEVLMPFVLTDGSKISDYMPEELYQKASDLLREAKLPASFMKIYNLAMWSQLVEQAALITKTNYDLSSGMDRALIQHCYDKSIEVRDVESAELQYSILAAFPDELNLLMIEQTLKNLDDYQAGIDKLYNAWINGDPKEIAAVINEEDAEEMAAYTEKERALLEDYSNQMLTQRNLGMRDRAVEWLKAGDKVFFAVGAAHLVNEDGLIALLQAEGYTVEQLSY